jgi:hypothetical protein
MAGAEADDMLEIGHPHSGSNLNYTHSSPQPTPFWRDLRPGEPLCAKSAYSGAINDYSRHTTTGSGVCLFLSRFSKNSQLISESQIRAEIVPQNQALANHFEGGFLEDGE